MDFEVVGDWMDEFRFWQGGAASVLPGFEKSGVNKKKALA